MKVNLNYSSGDSNGVTDGGIRGGDPRMYLRVPSYRAQFIIFWDTDGLARAIMRKVRKPHSYPRIRLI